MNPDFIAKVWIFRGLSDLYFGFRTEGMNFSDYALFFEIMGLEKFLKAQCLFSYGQHYQSLPEDDAKGYIDRKAKCLGHNIENLLKRVQKEIGPAEIKAIKTTTFDGYLGRDLIRAINAGYIETRYPVPRPISDNFRIKGTDLTWDPLSSSGITKFIYRICNLVYRKLSAQVDFSDLLSSFNEKYQHEDAFRRFNNLFWEPQSGVSL